VKAYNIPEEQTVDILIEKIGRELRNIKETETIPGSFDILDELIEQYKKALLQYYKACMTEIRIEIDGDIPYFK
jgi:hypothetical protein